MKLTRNGESLFRRWGVVEVILFNLEVNGRGVSFPVQNVEFFLGVFWLGKEFGDFFSS